jgi:hypothetical protein
VYASQEPYRQLYDAILSYEGGALYGNVVRPWLAMQDGERRWLDELRPRTGHPVPPVTGEELSRLYALSRILQLLHLSFAPRTGAHGPAIAPIQSDEYAAFLAGMGLQTAEHAAFHPFHHEIAVVDQAADEDAPPEVAEVLWPGCRVGPLLMSRAGCRVRAGKRHLVKEIAENSTLYWAYARANRPSADLSHGWGSSSQWRTGFRRDYLLDGALHYNVDAREAAGGPRDDLTAAERTELLRHRCFVTCAKPSDDRRPYDLRLVEPA